MRPCIIIPAKNEARNVAAVITGIRSHLPDALIVIVDDHSDDRTGEVAAAHPGVTVLHSPVSIGIGGAVQLGVRYGLAQGCQTFLRMDGDGQHPPEALRSMLASLLPGGLVQGSRDPGRFTASSTAVRSVGSAYFRTLFRLFTGRPVIDPTSGFMCFGRDIAGMFARFYPLDFPEIESLVLLVRAGHPVVSLPVTMQPRATGKSSIGPLRSAIYMASVSIAFFSSFIRVNPYGGARAV